MPKVEWKGGALLAPLPAVIVTSKREGERANALTVAWCGIISTHPPRLYISLRPSRHSYGIIKESGEFAVNLVPVSLVRAADTCGVLTGKKVDKIEKCHLALADSFAISAPSIASSPLTLECRVCEILPQGSHDMFIADIVATAVDESLIDESGALKLSKANLSAFAHGEYFELGRVVGSFGYSVRKKKKNKKTGEK